MLFDVSAAKSNRKSMPPIRPLFKRHSHGEGAFIFEETPMLIPLTQGKFAIIDDEDYDAVSSHGWSALKTKSGWRPRATINRKVVYLYRFIMRALTGVYVDHINRNPLDNRRANLRFCTHSQNQMNGVSHKNSTSQYKGVSWQKGGKSWRAQIWVNSKKIHIGCFKNERDAARAYNKKAKELHGQFARLNVVRS